MRLAVSTLVAVLVLAVAPAARADYYVVVSEQNPTRSLSRTEVLHLFMGRSRSFPDGSRATTCDMSDDQHRRGFYRSLSGMSLAQVTSYWARLMFSGRALPPEQLDDQDALVDRVRNDPTAIGWLPEAPRQKGLRTVLVIKAEP